MSTAHPSAAVSPTALHGNLYRKVTLRLITLFCPVLLRGLSRPHQHRAAKLQMLDALKFSDTVYARRRPVLRRLHPVRSPEQPGAATRRREVVDRADHDHVGPAVGCDDVRAHADAVLRRALPARRGRGRLPARRAAVPDAVVSRCTPRADRRAVHGRAAAVEHDRQPDLRVDHARVRRHARGSAAGSGCSCSKRCRRCCSASRCCAGCPTTSNPHSG